MELWMQRGLGQTQASSVTPLSNIGTVISASQMQQSATQGNLLMAAGIAAPLLLMSFESTRILGFILAGIEGVALFSLRGIS